MRVLVVGKGGREHALAAKILESRQLSQIWVAPGNAGIQRAGIPCVAIEKVSDIVSFCVESKMDLVVLGPEAAILSDLKASLEQKGISCFSPTPQAGHMEASKVFCKNILAKAGLPTAAFEVATTAEQALTSIEKHNFSQPLVVKADGLAQGKGVHVCENKQTAINAVTELAKNYGFPLLLEECLQGPELSAFALCDGKDFVLLGTACDYKRITSDPFSANTGGMGAYSPCDFLTGEDEEQITQIFKKTLRTMSDEGMPFQGFLFAGLMKTATGLQVLEFNVRMGDPETQALLPRIESDLLELIVKALQLRLKGQEVEFKDASSVHVVVVSGGYPEPKMLLGHPISGADQVSKAVNLYYSGVQEKNGQLLNSGGRVLGITALAQTRAEARSKAYLEISKIGFEGHYFREDIAR